MPNRAAQSQHRELEEHLSHQPPWAARNHDRWPAGLLQRATAPDYGTTSTVGEAAFPGESWARGWGGRRTCWIFLQQTEGLVPLIVQCTSANAEWE